jgi:hypothetical protein
MSITLESTLTREFDIRFIDARSIVNEAKVKMGIFGYPSKGDEPKICREARRLFESQSHADKEAMWRLSANFQAIKDSSSSSFSAVGSSVHQGTSDDSRMSAVGSVSSSSTRSSSSSMGNRKRMLLGMMGRRV